jgi:hypothetical protein
VTKTFRRLSLAIALTINGVTYNYPVNGEDSGTWGESGTDWAEAVTDVLNTLISPGDILTTTATINDNIAVFTDVNGLNFDPTLVRAANVSYSIYRISNDNPSGHTENGTIYLNYDNSAGAGLKWTLAQQINGNSGVIFNITDLGQVQYKSSQIDTGGGGYSGVLKFNARTLGI